MCIIAIQPKNFIIDENTLRNCWDNNNDGAGIMYAIDGKVIVHKELSSFRKFMKHKEYVDSLNVNCVIHFRISTSGKIDKNNIHPFKVNEHLHFCHNGMLDIDVPSTSLINDTQIFNNGLLRSLPLGFQKNDGIMNLIKYSIGNRNKFVFLDSMGEFYIVNEDAGMWDEGIWFSNSTYQYSYKTYSKKSTFSDFDLWDINECEACQCKTHSDSLVMNTEWDMLLCKSCNDFAFQN
jgi:predicted glutamine amidotransferase